MATAKRWDLFRMTLFILLVCGQAPAQNFVSNGLEAPLYGVYEVVYTADELPEDPIMPGLVCEFEPPGETGKTRRVACFGTGDGSIHARCYVDTVGKWGWKILDPADPARMVAGGSFSVTHSELPGRLMPTRQNPQQWMRENGEWFLNLNDTAYFLLSPVDNSGAPISEDQARAYVEDAMKHGITSFRSFPPTGSLRLGSHLVGELAYLNSVFGDHAFREPNLANYTTADTRLRMLLDDYPEACIQFVILPLASEWAKDEPFWQTLPLEKRERLLRYVLARFAAYPQIFWLVENDAHYGEKWPMNNALAREVGTYLQANDPWQHPRSTGPARGVPFLFAEEDWATYIHLEQRYDLNAESAADYQHLDKPVFLGEDYYEQDRERSNPVNMRYFQRRLFWSWLLSGASANYGSRWCYLHPYSQTGKLQGDCLWPYIEGGEGETMNQMPDYVDPLVGLDSVRVIRDFFRDRQLDLSLFHPDPSCIKNLNTGKVEAPPKLMRMNAEAWLAYHPNALENGKAARPDPDAYATLEVNLSDAAGEAFAGEWLHCGDGRSELLRTTLTGGQLHALQAPWKGTDVVLLLRQL